MDELAAAATVLAMSIDDYADDDLEQLFRMLDAETHSYLNLSYCEQATGAPWPSLLPKATGVRTPFFPMAGSSLCYVWDLVCVMYRILSMLCAEFSPCYVQSLVVLGMSWTPGPWLWPGPPLLLC